MLSIDIKVFCDLFCKGGGKGGGQFKGLKSLFKRGPPSSRYVSFIHSSFLNFHYFLSFFLSFFSLLGALEDST
jgi:hypothetical protein